MFTRDKNTGMLVQESTRRVHLTILPVYDEAYFTLMRELKSEECGIDRVAVLALESLTPGGSEFVGDVQKCLDHIRERRAAADGLIKRYKLERDAADEEAKLLQKMIDDLNEQSL